MTLFSRFVTSYVTRQNHRVHGHCESFHHQLPWHLRASLERRSHSYSSEGGIRVGAPNRVPAHCSTTILLGATLTQDLPPPGAGGACGKNSPTHHALAPVSVAQGASSCHGSLHRLLVTTTAPLWVFRSPRHREFWCCQLGAAVTL